MSIIQYNKGYQEVNNQKIYRIIAEKASPMIMGGDESAILIFSQCGN